MEKGVDRDVDVPSLSDVALDHRFGDVVDIGAVAPVVARHALGKAGGSAGVEDVGEILHRIQLHPGQRAP